MSWEPTEELVEKCVDALPEWWLTDEQWKDIRTVVRLTLQAAVESGELVPTSARFRRAVQAAQEVVQAVRDAGLIGCDSVEALQAIDEAIDAYDAATRNATEENDE